MKSRLLVLASIVLFLQNVSSFSQQPRNPMVFTVNSVADSFDVFPGDGACADSLGRCTLRAAVGEASESKIGGDGIMFSLPNPSVIDLTLGELILSGPFMILGPGPDRLTIQRSFAAGTPEFRIFRINGGGAAYLELRGVTLKNGKASHGGAIHVEQSTLRVANVVVTGNQALFGGGVYSSGSVRITRSLFDANTATNTGGAIELVSGLPSTESVISDTTITNNEASTAGAISNARSLSLVNNTISHNSATTDISGVLNSSGGTIHVVNTIIGSNTMPKFTLGGAFVSSGNNIITDARNSTGFSDGVLNDKVGTSNSIDPLLGSLADNGGGLLTRAPQAGSIALNAGNNCVYHSNACQLPTGTNVQLVWDQRQRYSRWANGGVDIGAFESNAVPSTYVSGFRTQISPGGYYSNSVVVLTDVVTAERKFAVVNPTGSFQFFDVDFNGTYFLEYRSKRQLGLGVSIFLY